MADREKAPRRAASQSSRSVLPSQSIHPLAQKAALLACSRKIDPQRETHRWRRESRANPSPKMGLFRTILDGKKLVLVLKIAKNRHP
jgi:hypothetical protein